MGMGMNVTAHMRQTDERVSNAAMCRLRILSHLEGTCIETLFNGIIARVSRLEEWDSGGVAAKVELAAAGLKDSSNAVEAAAESAASRRSL